MSHQKPLHCISKGDPSSRLINFILHPSDLTSYSFPQEKLQENEYSTVMYIWMHKKGRQKNVKLFIIELPWNVLFFFARAAIVVNFISYCENESLKSGFCGKCMKHYLCQLQQQIRKICRHHELILK